MATEMIGSVSTGIDLNETKAVESINRLKSAVKDATREWQINEAQSKTAGDSVTAAKARYEGLTEAIDKQKKYIAELSTGMKSINRDTEDGEKAYQKYNSQLTTAERSLASMTGQLNRAKTAYDQQRTGILELNKSLDANDKLMKSQVDLYEKTNNKVGAAKAELSGLTTSYTKQSEIYKAHVLELKRLESAENSSTESIVKQKTKVNESATSLIDYKNRMLEANVALTKLRPFNENNVLGKGFNTLYETSEKVTSSMAAGFQKVKSAAYQSAFGIVAIGAAAVKGSQVAVELQESYVKTYNLIVTGGEDAKEATENVAKMQEDATKYSVEYGKSQKEIAEGYQELVKRGYTSAEAVGAMRSELEASIASGDDFNEVLSVASQVVDAYGLRTDNAAKMTENTKEVVNKLAYAADMTATDFQSMGKAMEYVGDTGHSAGIKLAEASSAIGILSNHGLEADKAGTGLRKVINSITGALSDQDAAQGAAEASVNSLTNKIAEHQKKLDAAQASVKNGTKNNKSATKAIQTQKEAISKLQDKLQQVQSSGAKDMLSNLGIKRSDLVDANGDLRDLTSIMAIIDEKTKNMGTAEKNSVFQMLFGTTGQQAGIILAQNNKELEELNKKVEKSAEGQGYVTDLAKKNMNTVQAELNQFKQAGEAVLIMIGNKFLPVMSEAATSMAKAFNSEEGKKGLETIAGFVADIFKGMIDLVKFVGENKKLVVDFGVAFATIWSVKKFADVIVWLTRVKNSLLEIKAIDALTGGLGGGGITKTVGGKVADEAAIATSSSALSKFGGILSKIIGFAGTTAGASLLSGGAGAATELMSKDTTQQKVGGVAGSLGGAAAGAAIGSMIAPGIGTAICAAIGGLGGKELGKKIGDTIHDGIEESKLKSEKLPIVAFDPTKPTKEMKEFSTNYEDFLSTLNSKANVEVVNEESLEKAKTNVEAAFKTMGTKIDDFYEKLSKDSKKNVSLLVANGVLTQDQADALNKSQEESNKKGADSQKKTLKEMQENTKKHYEKVAAEQKLSGNFSNQLAQEHETKLSKIKSGSTQTLLDIEKKYGKDSPRYKKAMDEELAKENERFRREELTEERNHKKKLQQLEKEYAKEQTKKNTEMNKEISTATKISKNKQIDFLEEVKNRKGKLSLGEYTETVRYANSAYKDVEKAANEQKDAAVKAANKKYKETVEAANKERAENTSMSKDQYDEIIKNAKNQRKDSIELADKQKDESIRAAKKDHDDTVEFANQKADKTVKAVAASQGQTVKEYGSSIENSANIFNWFIDKINGILNWMHDGWGKIPRLSGKLPMYAKGTKGLATDEIALVGEEGFELAHHPNKGIFAVGASGPEIRGLQAGTSILPHGKSKEFLSMVSTLPAHADGVEGFISDASSWLKEKYEDVMGLVSNSPKSVVDGIYNMLGLGEKTEKMSFIPKKIATGSMEKVKSNTIDYLNPFFDKAKKESGGNQGAPSGAGVQRWAGQVKSALSANGLSTSEGMVNKVLRQIATESSGNEKAVQGDIGDINNQTGDLAKGLMQTISATFNAYKFPGHGDIFNGYDNLLAALNYAKNRYGSDLSFLGQGHGYENGGVVSSHGLYEIAEGNRPEMIIPLDPQKKSRATELLNQATQTIHGSNKNTEALELSQVTSLLGKLIDVVADIKSNPIPAYAVIDGKNVSDVLAPYTSKSVNNWETQQNRMRGIL